MERVNMRVSSPDGAISTAPPSILHSPEESDMEGMGREEGANSRYRTRIS